MDTSTGDITFNQFSDSLDLVGGISGTESEYTVTVTYEAGSLYDTMNFPSSDTRTFNVNVKNPCIDPSFVTISNVDSTLTTKDYVVFAPAEQITPGFSAFTINTVPVTHTLCGAVQLTGQYEDGTSTLVDLAGGEPITLDTATRVFTV